MLETLRFLVELDGIEPPTIEVTPAPMNQEPRFKNKVQELIWRAKQYKL